MPKSATPIPLPTVVAKDTAHLIALVQDAIVSHGLNCDLNHIDVSGVADMRNVFLGSRFDGDISQWDVSNVTTMRSMFAQSLFKGDISRWNTSKVEDMSYMFEESCFNGDVSKWNVSNVAYMTGMFFNSDFDGDLSQWCVVNVQNTAGMFAENLVFQGDLSQWVMPRIQNIANMFMGAYLAQDVSAWSIGPDVHKSGLFDRSGDTLLRQTPCAWNIPIFLEAGLNPRDAHWKDAFERIAPIAQSLGLNLIEQTTLIIEEHKKDGLLPESAGLPCNLLGETAQT